MEERKNVVPHKLESTERELYNSNKEIKNITRHELKNSSGNIPGKWSQDMPQNQKKKKKHLMYSKKFRMLFGIAILFFVGSLSFALLNFFQGGSTVSNNNIDIVVLGNSFVDGGEELPLQIKVANRNRTSLEIADMLIEYPKGIGGVNDVARQRVSLGEIGSGRVAEEIVNVSVFGEQGSVRDIDFTLEYRVANSNAIFVKEYTYQVTIATSPVDVLVEGPDNIISNQQFSTNITVIQNSTEVTQNMMVVASYPSGFKFESATPAPDFGNNKWVLGDLAPGTEKDIQIRGSIRASNGEERIITILSGSQNPDDEQEIGVQYTATPLDFTIGAPFVSATVGMNQNKDTEFTIPSNGTSNFNVYWENELENSLNSLEVRLRFSGNGFDPSRVTVNQGYFDTNTNTIIWNQTNNNSLGSINPGEKGQLMFGIVPKTGVSNPTINIAIDVQGVISGQSSVESVSNVYNGTMRVSSDVSISSKLFYNQGPFVNSGNLPPQVGQETTYTVEWVINSSTSDLQDVEVTAELPAYVTWKNNIYPQNANVTYSSASRRVTWKINELSSTSGPEDNKVHFQVALTPSSSQITTAPTIVSSGNFSAKDAFTGDPITKTFQQVTTVLSSDSGYNSNNDRVVE